MPASSTYAPGGPDGRKRVGYVAAGRNDCSRVAGGRVIRVVPERVLRQVAGVVNLPAGRP